jgi:hypothetical protein
LMPPYFSSSLVKDEARAAAKLQTHPLRAGCG